MNFYRISIRQMITDVVVVILLTSMVIIGTKAGVTWLKTHIWDFFTPFLMTFFLLGLIILYGWYLHFMFHSYLLYWFLTRNNAQVRKCDYPYHLFFDEGADIIVTSFFKGRAIEKYFHLKVIYHTDTIKPVLNIRRLSILLPYQERDTILLEGYGFEKQHCSHEPICKQD